MVKVYVKEIEAEITIEAAALKSLIEQGLTVIER